MDIKDQLKDIPINQVAESLGLGLQKHGANLQGNCPSQLQGREVFLHRPQGELLWSLGLAACQRATGLDLQPQSAAPLPSSSSQPQEANPETVLLPPLSLMTRTEVFSKFLPQ